jgi:hypothetical protein
MLSQKSNDYENQHIPATRTFQKTSNKRASFTHFNLLNNCHCSLINVLVSTTTLHHAMESANQITQNLIPQSKFYDFYSTSRYTQASDVPYHKSIKLNNSFWKQVKKRWKPAELKKHVTV